MRMYGIRGRKKRARHNCRRKARYSTWAAANEDALRVWRKNDTHANPATPYPCMVCNGYHLANWVPPLPRNRERFVIRVSAEA